MAAITRTDFHQKLDYTFGSFSEHPAVISAVQRFRMCASSAVNIAIHLQKNNGSFELEENIGALRGPRSALELLVSHINDFYADTNFAAFFRANYDYFLEHSERFRKDVLDKFNFEWFRPHGLNPDNMRTILSPTASWGFVVWLHDESLDKKIVYGTIPTCINYSLGHTSWLVHEFAHGFANPMAEAWLRENSEFRNWVNTSLESGRIHYVYNNHRRVAHEYVTRAFEILYMVENTGANPSFLLLVEIDNGFLHIQEVYALITAHEIIDLEVYYIFTMLGISGYYLSEEQSYERGDTTVTWRFLDLQDHEPMLDNLLPRRFGIVNFGSQTGQFLYVYYDDSKFLHVDIGSTQEFGWQTEPYKTRVYFVIRIC